jgi:hypothetical protein
MKPLKLLPVIGIALFIYIIWANGPMRIAEIFLSVNYAYLLFAVIVNGSIVVLKGIKWRMVMNLHGFDYPLKNCIRVWCTGLFASIITPGRAGDLIRVFYLKDSEENFGKRLSSVVVDRIFDLVSVLIFASLGIFFFSFWFGSGLVSLGVLLLFVVFLFGVIYLIANKKIAIFFVKPAFNFFMPEKHKAGFKNGFHDFYKSIGGLKGKKQSLFALLLFTMAIWLVSIFQVYLISLSLGMDAGYVFFLVIISIVSIIELIPVSIMGVGTRDAFLILSFSVIGASSQMAIAFSIIYLIISYWLAGILGLVFWMRNPVKLKI